MPNLFIAMVVNEVERGLIEEMLEVEEKYAYDQRLSNEIPPLKASLALRQPDPEDAQTTGLDGHPGQARSSTMTLVKFPHI